MGCKLDCDVLNYPGAVDQTDFILKTKVHFMSLETFCEDTKL